MQTLAAGSRTLRGTSRHVAARLFKLYAADQYGAREPILAYADLLLSEPQLREMVTGIESELDNAPTPSEPGARPAHDAHSSLTALTLLSHALRDPGIHVRATLRRSPQPNSMQKQDFVLQYMDVGCDRATARHPFFFVAKPARRVKSGFAPGCTSGRAACSSDSTSRAPRPCRIASCLTSSQSGSLQT